MRRILFLLTLVLFCLNLAACDFAPALTVPDTGFSEANFNNNYWFNGNFWVLGDHVFYLRDGFYNEGAYWSANGKVEKLFQESDFNSDAWEYNLIGDIFVSDDSLYFEIVTDQKTFLYRYDLKERTYSLVCEIPSLYRWVVVDDYFIYREHPANSSEKHSPLFIYHLKDGTTKQVCSDVEEFGIVNGELRYITLSDRYSLFRYDYAEDASTLIGTFPMNSDRKFSIFNFTSDFIVMYTFTKNNPDLFVYSCASGTTSVYPLPKGINHVVAYDQYAYLVVYDEPHNQSGVITAKENGIYRICLADGSYEVIISKINSGTEVHVVSDDCCYINQSHRTVYRYDYTSGTKEKIATLKVILN